MNLHNEDIEKLLESFTPMIKNKLRNTSYQERDDLEQELKMKICEKADMLLCQDVPGFWEFITNLLENL
ncbi:sigma-O factor regulator RsoA [Bacillus swezeyi]|uniref:Helix-turn-helix conjugative transposon-like domain-containing protein n=1 Tax=Bacillus swezeyi TaxID=1925020 RepID=A0A1R1QCH8_9BACI|nr:sigma-O factor regulator RsoA [Bacillus swezeyi]MEC1259590.1 sigma-O factor regulator RsoA [Bacillus swezeyi]MED1739337.1 sigma-O factor regulator RsoA [Bacillus swezeyi]MED2927447.1 sigma-O factor regulator RsoA [Bacillus swezeyi]MED2941699.1 sigma-O factor regulator RsoA [Bacillus swezeyi]MED2962645.1 sigma-O factor regulator RsoA [Bacillus swezeyi]